MKLIKAVFLGLVLTSFVLALPTERERTELKEEQRELMGERREERRDSNSVQLDRKDEERREVDRKDKDEERREVDRKDKDEERREVDRKENERRETLKKEKERREAMKKEEKRREKEEEKEEKRREKEEKKEKERRGTDAQRREVDRKEKDEERREVDRKDKDEERREVDRKDKDEERREVDRKDKDEERREVDRKAKERRGTDKIARREAERKDKDEERREVDRKDKEEERREADRKEEERRETGDKRDKERREVDRKDKDEERREVDRKDKDEERREVDRKEKERRETMKKEKEEKRREKEEEKEEMKREKEEKKERREKEEKKETERRGTDAQKREAERKDKDEERREVDRKDKDEERREVDRKDKDEERREVDRKAKERRGTDAQRREAERKDKDEERREVDRKDKDEERREVDRKETERREAMKKDEELRETEAEREKRRPTPAMEEKEAKRESMASFGEKIEREVKKVREVEAKLNEKMDQLSETAIALNEEKRQKRDSSGAKRDTSVAICESVTDFKYFQKIENEPTKYIQCDPWGTGKVKTCPEGLLWNEWTLICDPKEKIHNMTLDLSKFSVTTASRPVVNCSLAGIECLNGGSCVQATSGDYKCWCRTDYTGQFCESRVDFTDITHEILNSTFSVVDYRKHLQEENLTMSISYYEKFKDQLDNLTYTELIKYLSFYKDGEVRFDTLINSLVEDILENIYPDAEYLSVFNATQQNVVSMVQMIPSLLSYSRYSFERYEDVFAQYQQVLTTLSKSLNTTLPRINEEATQYTILTRIFLNQTASLMSSLQDHSLVENTPVDQPIQLSEADIKKALQYNYNETLKATEKLITILETFQNSVVKELETNPGVVVKLTLGEAKFPGAQDMLTVLNQVSTASSQIWESLVNYGFWYLTNLFSSADKVASIDKFAFNLNKF